MNKKDITRQKFFLKLNRNKKSYTFSYTLKKKNNPINHIFLNVKKLDSIDESKIEYKNIDFNRRIINIEFKMDRRIYTRRIENLSLNVLIENGIFIDRRKKITSISKKEILSRQSDYLKYIFYSTYTEHFDKRKKITSYVKVEKTL